MTDVVTANAGFLGCVTDAAQITAQHKDGNGRLRYLLASRELSQAWLAPPRTIQLVLLYEFDELGLCAAVVSDRQDLLESLSGLIQTTCFSIAEFAKRENVPLLDPRNALALRPVSIPKPWGQEVWFTGIEQRGVCEVDTAAAPCPLPWLQALLSETYSGLSEAIAPVLLKILDPYPEPIIGDLYFELHEVKQEVYVITSIDEAAWPEGIGRIRIGFNPDMRVKFGDDASFKDAYSKAVAEYRGIRVEIDEWLDTHCPMHSDVLTLEENRARLDKVPQALANTEYELRQRMEHFTQLHGLEVGDVVTIPRCLPHALQHGVRAVEFQTPVYERKIVSFAQKVLTQNHWDTEEALAISRTDDYTQAPFDVERIGGCAWQRIVEFDHFEVWRAEIDAGGDLQLPAYASYQLLMPISHCLDCNGTSVDPEQAVLLLRSMGSVRINNPHTSDAVSYLLARPRTPVLGDIAT